MKLVNLSFPVRSTLGACVCAAMLLGSSAESFAQIDLADFTGSVPADFTFAQFDNNTTPTADGLLVQFSSDPDTFGGAGIDANILAMPALTDADSLTVRAKLGADNTTDFVVAFREASGEFFSYNVPASAFNTSTFEDYTVTDLTSWFFNGDSTDGLVNDTVVEVSIQTPFGGTGGADVIVESISATIIPEPTSIALMGLAGLAIASMRRR